VRIDDRNTHPDDFGEQSVAEALHPVFLAKGGKGSITQIMSISPCLGSDLYVIPSIPALPDEFDSPDPVPS